MSTHVQCPSCGQPAANIVSPNKRWGSLFDDLEMDRAFDPEEAAAEDGDRENFNRYTFCSNMGRETFECQCGGSIWVADRQGPEGRWFVAVPQIKSLQEEGT
jgi:hypothetical protein